MEKRLELHSLLLTLGTANVYFQPPSNLTMKYPCIVYQRDAARTLFADNRPYSYGQRYQVTVIDRDPDSPIRDKVKELPKCLFDRFFVANNLNHDVFTLYY